MNTCNNVHLMLVISGSQEYECCVCGQTYRYPNPLKAHIRFTCRTVEEEEEAEGHIKHEPLNSVMDTGPRHRHMLYGKASSAFSRYTDGHPRERRKQTDDSAFRVFSGTSYAQTPNAFENHPADSQNYPRGCSTNIHPRNGHIDYPYGCHMTCGVSNTAYYSPYKLNASVSVASDIGCAVSVEPKHVTYSGQCSWDESKPKCATRHPNLSTFPLPSEADGEPIDVLHRSFLALSSKKGHLCIYCGKFYSRKYGLKIHLRTHTGYKPLKCKVCFRAFGDPSNLNKHIRLHAEGDTPYKCDFCGKVLVRRRDLTRHIKSRHPDVVENEIEEHSDE